jgi:DNA repair exonuclease SbcCD ATPase subunit
MNILDPIERLSITDFRSIRGPVEVPLDAPIVLVHGANGAGKTSILSALELALTGDLPTMRRADENFMKFLVHNEAQSAHIEIVTGKPSTDVRGRFEIKPGNSAGKPFLEAADARFFSERCLLAQSALSRLLETYQIADPNTDSALTHFVKDLLNLDQLDAVIDGLYDAGDVRRTRKLVEEYKEAEDLLKEKKSEAEKLVSERHDVDAQISSELLEFQNDLDVALPGTKASLADLSRLKDELAAMDVGSRLLDERGRLSELQSLQKTWSGLPPDSGGERRGAVEAAATEAWKAAEAWRVSTGVELESLTQNLRSTFPDLPSWSSTDPGTAYRAAAARVREELARLQKLLESDAANLAKERELRESAGREEARLKLLAARMGKIASDAGQLAVALAGILPHAHTDDCPVCGRPFNEISKEPLSGYLQRTIAKLTEDAGLLAQLSSEQAAATARLADLNRQLERLRGVLLAQDAKIVTGQRIAALSDNLTTLTRIEKQSLGGATLLAVEAEAARNLGTFRETDRLSNELRESASRLSVTAGGKQIRPSEQFETFLATLQQTLSGRVSSLQQLQRGRESAQTRCLTLLRLQSRSNEIAAELRSYESDIETLTAAIGAANVRRNRAKVLGNLAWESRTQTVRKVFNESLNILWRDLFVRLAPTEPFVPAFRLPSGATDVAATLETVHRSGKTAGTPGSMLSSGNLNTAALTLFLALHFSVASSRLPWLVLDDPVQSMDEVHIAQFAALLRTLSKIHGRKIIMAVHERPLFDYLALELGPAFEHDRLLLIEIRRTFGEGTVVVPTYRSYEADTIAA